jgi:tetratricopeptide (TPR) repeat protein
MAKFDTFVGREKELALIDAWAERPDSVHLILIGGDGGIGKSFLVQKVANEYRKRAGFVVDFYDLAEQPPGHLREALHMAESLGWEHFPEFQAQVRDLASGRYEIDDPILGDLEEKALNTSVAELKQLLQHRKLIRITDTLDAAVPGRAQELGLLRSAKELGSVLAIAAGRAAHRHLHSFIEALGEENVTYLELSSFDPVETGEFFDEVDRNGFIPDDMRQKLHLLTGGRPVLLSLAVEWLYRNVPLPEIAGLSLKAFEAMPEPELQALRDRFEFELVDRVRGLKSPLDRAILCMAHVNRRSDARVLSALLDVPLPNAEDLVAQLADHSFVKYNPATQSCLLHDEMKVLVNQHAWAYVDPTGEVRRKLTRKAISGYYQPRLQQLARQIRAQADSERGPVRRANISAEEWEQWWLEAECLHYQLTLSEAEGLAYFTDRFLEAQRNNHLVRIQFLLSEMEIAGHTDIRDTVELRRADTFRMSGQVDLAEALCRSALEKETLSLDNRISAHVTLGWIAASSEAEEALRHFETALSLAQKKDDSRLIGTLYNNLGRVYRLAGQLDQAVQYFQQAIAYSTRAENWPLVASARNNLAFVYRLRGNLSEADATCRVALAQRKKIGIERDLAYSYLTKAEIDRDKGDLESAERYTKLALRSFDKVGERRGQVMAYLSLANVHRHLNQYERAETYLDEGIALLRQINDDSLLASLYSVYGREQRDRARHLHEFSSGDSLQQVGPLFERAQEYLGKGVELAERYGDRWLLTRTRFELALTYFMCQARSDEEIAGLLEQVWDGAARLKDNLIQGYVHELRARLALKRNRYALSAEHFGLAAQLITRHPGREADRFFDRISELLLYEQPSSEAATTLARGILDAIADSAHSQPLQSLLILCQQVLDLQAIGG